ncbi:ABC transporter ATP-binding protein/permease [Dehalococcoidia bacterium]|nr:ABC transporter ATP-binding protein/permease [Dehalococcoidia bacterium]
MHQIQRPNRWKSNDLNQRPQWQVLARLIGYGWRHRLHLAGAFFTMGGATLSAMVIPWILGNAIDEAFQTGLRSQFVFLALAILGFGALRAGFSYGQNYLSEAVSQKAAYDLRKDFFQKLQSLSFGFHDRQQTGNLMSKATSDVEACGRFISMGLIRGASTLLTLGVVTGVMLLANWRLGIVCLIFVPILVWRSLYMSRRLRHIWMKVQMETGNMTTVLQENVAGIRLVKSFGASDLEERKFGDRATSLANLTYSATRMFASQGSLMTFIFTVAIGTILWFGGREVIAERLTPGDLAAFILYMGILMMPVRMIGFLIMTLSRASSAGQRIMDVLDAESPVKEDSNAITLTNVSGHVRFENVSLSYDQTSTVAVDDINLDVQAGQLVAILGAPGSGKTSIMHLIPRFYDVTGGRITVDGRDVREVTLESLRKNVGVVLQDLFVFGTTIKDNIAYGADSTNLHEIVRASKIAQFHEFVESLPNGYDTWIGERGVTLSGGQNQRLAIARTILLDPPILILDDSTSSVDIGTEYLIQSALEEVIKGRTTFVIAHRLSTVRKADLILVIDKGRIVERGSHVELMKRGGFYQRIHDLQLTAVEGNSTEIRSIA